MKVLRAILVDDQGEEIGLGPTTKRRFQCPKAQCTFPACGCGPESTVELHSPGEPRTAKKP